MTRGLCQTPAYARLFTGPRRPNVTPGANTKAAKDVCRRCDVLAECLPWALKQEGGAASHRDGVLGGLTARERAERAGATDAAGEGIDDEDGAA
jgi:hypothetical protein